MVKAGGAMADVIVVGGGVIGLSIAYELAGRGVSVQLLEQGEIGREASWAGAGMLPPGNLEFARTPEARLRGASHALWPEWSQRLREETGIENGYVRCGAVQVFHHSEHRACAELLAAWQSEHVASQLLNRSDVEARFPMVSESVSQAIFLPDMGQVRNPRHLKALAAAGAQRGVKLTSENPVVGVNRTADRIVSVRTPSGDFGAGEFVFAGGAWSTQLLEQAGVQLAVEPVRGQMVLLEQMPLPFRLIIEHGKRYLVPRLDGKILVGSTEERVGFQKNTTADAIAELLRFGTDLVPSLRSARFLQAWSGLRPYREGELPYLGRIDGLRNACIAAGHFRAGLQLSPITAVLIRQVVLGEQVSLPAECHASCEAGL